MKQKLLTFSQLREHGVVFTRRHLARLEALGLFPKKVKIGKSRVGWVAEEIKAYVEALIEAREE